MMNGDGVGQGRSKEPVERAIDLFVHTPIGLAVMAWRRVPEFVGSVPDLVGQVLAKGCAQLAEAETRLSKEVRKARMIGQVAVSFGGRQVRREVDTRLAEVRRTAEGVASFISGTTSDGQANGAAPWVSATATETAPRSPAPEPPAAKAPATKAPATKPRAAKAPAAKSTRARKAAKPPTAASAAGLPVREYDGLSASQVVSRLTGLTPDELRAVRAYEEASRGRRTILQAIDRLLG